MGRGRGNQLAGGLLEGRGRFEIAAPRSRPSPEFPDFLVAGQLWSYDREVKATFDAAPYLENEQKRAPFQALVDCTWQGIGETPLEALVNWIGARDEDVEAVIDYCYFNEKPFIVEIDAEAAMDWIHEHRPSLFKMLQFV